jgi:hypothetical protein
MPLDLDTFLTALYTVVDQRYRDHLAATYARRPGPKPTLSDAEVLTLAVCAEWGAWDSERAFWRFASARLRHLFPRLVDQSEFNRRRRALYPALAAIQRALAEQLGVALERERILDTKPVPVMLLKRHDERGLVFDGQAAVGWCQAKRLYYYGFKLVLSLTLDGVIARYELVPANTDDREAANEVLEPGCRYWADKGFAGQACEREWLAQGVPLARLARRVRQAIEVVYAQLTEQFGIERTRAKTLWGLLARVQAKLTAHTFGVYLNRLRGRPPLALKALVV